MTRPRSPANTPDFATPPVGFVAEVRYDLADSVLNGLAHRKGLPAFRYAGLTGDEAEALHDAIQALIELSSKWKWEPRAAVAACRDDPWL